MHEILNYAPSSRGEETSDWLVVAGSKRNMCVLNFRTTLQSGFIQKILSNMKISR